MVNKELASLFVLAHRGKVVQQLNRFPERNGAADYGCISAVPSSNLAALLAATAQKVVGLRDGDPPVSLRKRGELPHQ